MGFLYGGDVAAAITFLDSLADACRDEPLYLLVKSRINRELLTIDDENKELVEAESVPIHKDLDRLIEVCTGRMEAAEETSTLLLYRGMAWMAKSHLHSFARNFWRAARDAKKGKADLELFLSRHPHEPLALGTMGAFYYFADPIPGLFKFIARLLLLPTGDRQKGLAYLQAASRIESMYQVDFQVLLHAVYFLFEGRYEDGLEGVLSLLDDYPHYTRLACPVLLLRPLFPGLAGICDDKLDALDETAAGLPASRLDRDGQNLLRFLRAYSDRFYKGPSVAANAYRALMRQQPEHPDWVTNYARFELGRIAASQGFTVLAREHFRVVANNESFGYLRGDAEDMLADLDDHTRSPAKEPDWCYGIYRSEGKDLSSGTLVSADGLEGLSLRANFYLGDARLLAGDLEGALEAYQEVLRREVPAWDHDYQMLAAARAAEIHGLRGDYETASASLALALEYYHKEYLLDYILEGRQRFYRRLAKGEEKTKPNLSWYSSP